MGTPTGSCACLIEGIERSLCTNLCAANNFKVDHVKKPENMKIVQEAKIIYSAGFFITVSTESMKLAQAEAAKSGAKYCLNLSAPFLMQVPPFKAFILESLPMVDFLFCNETEAATFAETEGWETTDLKFIATRLSLVPMAKPGQRVVVITQGADPTIVCVRGKITEHPILALPKEKLVDTNEQVTPMWAASWLVSRRACLLRIAARLVLTQQASLYSTVAALIQPLL